MPRLTLLLLLTLLSLAAPAAVLTGAELPPFDSSSALEACSQYSTAGNRTQATDARGNVTAYTYDALNRLTQTSFPGVTARRRRRGAGVRSCKITSTPPYSQHGKTLTH